MMVETTMLIFSGSLTFTTILLTCFTAWYAYTTHKILKETNKPEIGIFLDFQTEHYASQNGNTFTTYSTYLRVRNTGTSIARHIIFEGDFSFTPVHSEPLNKIEFLTNGIDTMMPSKTKSYRLFGLSGPYDAIFKPEEYKNRKSTLTFNVSYKNVSGQTYKTSHIELNR